jgi:hypothetical protein
MNPRVLREALDGFWVYEHEVRPHSGLYGVADVLDGWISYDDGYALNVAAYRLGDPDSVLGEKDLFAIIDSRRDEVRRDVVFVWGRVDLTCNYAKNGYTVALSREQSASADVADLAASPDPCPAAVRAARRARDLGYSCEVSDSELQTEHLRVLDHWLGTHEVIRMHRAFALECLESHRRGEILRLDVRREGRLQGFGLLSMSSPRDAVYLQGFLRNEPGSRAGDCLLDHMTQLCRSAGVQKLHLGYTASDGLRRFKAKWGGVEDKRTRYSELVLTANSQEYGGLPAKDRSIRVARWLGAE